VNPQTIRQITVVVPLRQSADPPLGLLRRLESTHELVERGVALLDPPTSKSADRAEAPVIVERRRDHDATSLLWVWLICALIIATASSTGRSSKRLRHAIKSVTDMRLIASPMKARSSGVSLA